MSNNATAAPAKAKRDIIGAFVAGGVKGWKISTTSMMQNVIMAFVVIQFLNLSGLMDLISKIFSPIMGVCGLPGEAAAVYIAAILSGVGAGGAAAGLYAAGTLTAVECAILFPACCMMTGTVQYLGRILGATKIDSKYYGILVVVNMLLGYLAMFVMNLFV